MKKISKTLILCLCGITSAQAIQENYVFKATNKTNEVMVVWPLPIAINPAIMAVVYPGPAAARIGFNDYVTKIIVVKDKLMGDPPMDSAASLENYIRSLPTSDAIIYDVHPSDMLASPGYDPINFNIEIKNNKLTFSPTTELPSQKYAKEIEEYEQKDVKAYIQLYTNRKRKIEPVIKK